MINQKSIIILLGIIVLSGLLGVGYFFLESSGETQEVMTLEQAWNKADDARIEADLKQLIKVSKEIFETQKNYINLCDNTQASWLIEDIEKNLEIKVVCNDSKDEWAAQAPLQSKELYLCVDFKGSPKETNILLNNSTMCP